MVPSLQLYKRTNKVERYGLSTGLGNRAAQVQEGEKIDCLLKAEIWSQLQMGWIKEMWSPPRRWWIHCDEHRWMPLSSLFSPPGRVLILSWGSFSYVLWVTSGEVNHTSILSDRIWPWLYNPTQTLPSFLKERCHVGVWHLKLLRLWITVRGDTDDALKVTEQRSWWQWRPEPLVTMSHYGLSQP